MDVMFEFNQQDIVFILRALDLASCLQSEPRPNRRAYLETIDKIETALNQPAPQPVQENGNAPIGDVEK